MWGGGRRGGRDGGRLSDTQPATTCGAQIAGTWVVEVEGHRAYMNDVAGLEAGGRAMVMLHRCLANTILVLLLLMMMVILSLLLLLLLLCACTLWPAALQPADLSLAQSRQ